MKLTETPDRVRFSSLVTLSFDNPAATTFVVLPGGCVLASKRPHPFIYNALRICTGERPMLGRYSSQDVWNPLGSKECKKVLKDYEVWVATPDTPLSEEVLSQTKDVQKKFKGSQQVTDFWRKVIPVGRIWKNVRVPDIGVISAISFWLESDRLENATIDLVARAFKVEGPVYVETLDLSQPELYSRTPKAFSPVSKRKVSSEVAPNLTKEQIYDIVVKAHTSPWTLTALEKEVVAEWYGKGLPVPGTNGGYTTKAELNFRKVIGDSVVSNRFLSLFEKHYDKVQTSV